MILDKEIKINVHSKNLKHLLELGYENIKIGDLITVSINHLTNGSNVKINVKCNICDKEKKLAYKTYLKNIKHGDYYACSNKCSRQRIVENKKITIYNYKEFSYLIGLFQTDGTLYDDKRNRGKFQLELSKNDSDIIYKIKTTLNLMNINCSISKRKRTTNFGISDSITLSANELQFRNLLKDWNVPAGKKSQTISPPLHKTELSINDYIRGLYDGDGSLGYTNNGFPYVSFVTQSEAIKEFLINFIYKITLKPIKDPKRNKRDDVYNIVITKEDAIAFCKEIYPHNCLSINRKYINAQEIKKWIRPSTMRKIESRKKWNKEQDKFILSNSIEESMKILNRTKESIEMRLWRLKNQKP